MRKGKGRLVLQKSAKDCINRARSYMKRVCEQLQTGFETGTARCDAPGHDESRTQPPGRHSMQRDV